MKKSLSYSIQEAATLTGLGRTRLYEELNSGRLKGVKAGRRTLIPHACLQEWLASLKAYPAASPEAK